METIKETKESKWLESLKDGEAETLDFYIKTAYGFRIVNAIGLQLDNQFSGVPRVCNLLWLKYSVKWDRLWESYSAEYNPIWNVDGEVTETETRDLTAGHTGTDTTGATGTDTLTHTGTDTTGTTGTDTLKHTGTDKMQGGGTDKETRSGSDQRQTTGNVYGFDSGGAVPAESGSETVTAGIGTTTTKSENSTNTKDLTDSTTYGRQEKNTKDLTDSTTYGRTDTTTHNTEDTDKGTITRTTRRGGNIGVTMTQQMLEADADYWNKCSSLFFETVCKDVADALTYKIYTEDREESADGSAYGKKYKLDITSQYNADNGIEIAEIELKEA